MSGTDGTWQLPMLSRSSVMDRRGPERRRTTCGRQTAAVSLVICLAGSDAAPSLRLTAERRSIGAAVKWIYLDLLASRVFGRVAESRSDGPTRR